MPSLGELIAPRRLGVDFRWLMASSWTSNIGDGIALSAAPLLIASLTSSPLLVAGGAMMQFLPWLLFGLLAGSIADHHDRRRLVMLADGRARSSCWRWSSSSRPARSPCGSCSRRPSSTAQPRCSPTRPAARSCRCSCGPPISGSATRGCRPGSSSATSSPAPRWARSSSRSDRSGRSSCRSCA